MGARYEFRIRGRLGRPLLNEFRDLNLTAASERVETVLAGPVEDVAALHGLLRRFEALGIELLDVHRIADPTSGNESKRRPGNVD
jgi:hypothetical protein